jgi:hypothetical protein
MGNWFSVILTTGSAESILKAPGKDRLESPVNHDMFDATVKKKGKAVINLSTLRLL